jgi:hypothetical protein
MRSCCEHVFAGWDFTFALPAVQVRILSAVGR